ncbi:MAG: hypothetical protein AB7N71_04635, partial [Phycisphaerae bacterium]
MRKLLGGCGAFAIMATAISPIPAVGGVDPDCATNCGNTVTFQNSPNCGQINGAGATLFSDFFRSPAGTNDFIDVDGDGCFGFDPSPTPPCGFIDQLAPAFQCPTFNTCWLFTYRSVGSVNGVSEFITSQLTGEENTSIPGEGAFVNRVEYAAGGIITPDGCSDCLPSGSPVCIDVIDLALADVPFIQSTRPADKSGGTWDRTPGLTGYGFNPIPSNTGFNLPLPTVTREVNGNPVSLNTNIQAPDDRTVFDTTVAWGPIGYIANRRAGVEQLRMTEIQHGLVAGRLPNGENLVFVTRSNGSGTRNGMMNTSGIDPAWGRGDNVGDENPVSTDFQIGSNSQQTNGEGSSQVEVATQNWGLAIGYTGLSGGSRAVADSRAGRYEVIDVMFDDRGGSQYVRPSVDAVLDNCDPNTGWVLGGQVTFSTVGDPFQTDDMMPDYLENQAAAAYLRNIVLSSQAFEGNPSADENLNMPGDYLATRFFLIAGLDCQPVLTDPTTMEPVLPVNSTLQEFIRLNNDFEAGGNPFPYGTVNIAGLVPVRNTLTGGEMYSDGSVGAYADFNGNFTVSTGRLSQRNQLQGDFNNDGIRDISDIGGLVEAVADPRGFVTGEGVQGGDPGTLGTNYVIPEIIGDYNGDGNLNAEDVRYHADGLAIVDDGMGGRKLDRRAGFIAVDNAAVALRGVGNYFGTTLITGTYDAGDSRADVAGSIEGPAAGAQPLGADGSVDCEDVAYVQANFGD